MICAPSNAAIDEIIVRILSRGLIDRDANNFKPNILRLGVTNEKKQNEEISEITLEYILTKGLCNTDSAEYKQHLFTKIKTCEKEIMDVENMSRYVTQNYDIQQLKEKLTLLQCRYDKSPGNIT